MNNIFKKGFYILAALVLSLATSCNDDDVEITKISGLDFVIATLNLEGTEIGVVPTTVNSNNRIVYSVDFGATPDVATDNVATSGPMVTYEYPNVDGTYTITVTASLQGAADVSISKDVTITEYIAPTIPTGPTNALVGIWKMAPEAGSIAVGPEEATPGGWFSIPAEDIAVRDCFYDDEYIFNEDGTFENVLQGETWLGTIGDPPVECYGVSTPACGAPAFPFDGSASATYTYDAVAGTITLEGKGAFLGLANVKNGGEICPADAADELVYNATLTGNVLELNIQIDAANDAWWYFKLVREVETIVGTWKMAPEAGSIAVGPEEATPGGWFSIPAEDIAVRDCFYDDEYIFNEDGTFENVLQGETWLGTIGDPPVECYGVSTPACGAPAFPFDGSASATYTYDAVAGTVTLDGKGAFLGLANVKNGGEICPADAADELVYNATLTGNVLELNIQIDAANDAWWYFKLVKE